jgi:predicted transposase/invertase (TIGR01784 family)
MAKKKDTATTTGQYDKIFKENAESIYKSLIYALLRLDTSKGEDLLEKDLQYTLERKADFLKKIIPSDGLPPYVLHIEIQSENDAEMYARMLLYYALIYKKYKIETVQFVLYIGNEPLDMIDSMTHKSLGFSYKIIDIRRYDYEHFLQASTPEEVILAILGNFHGEKPETVIEQIIVRLQELTNTKLALGKYATQLSIISKLRKLEKETLNQIKDMPITLDFSIEDLPAFHVALKKGEEKAEAKAKAESIEKMLRKGFTPEQVVDILEVTMELVLSVQATITKS